MTKTPVTFVTGVDLHFDCQSICCFIILNHQAGEKVPEAKSRCRRRTSGTSKHLRRSIWCFIRLQFQSLGWRESARGEERMPPTYFWYVKAFVTKHMVLYSSDWYYLPGKNGHTIGITIRDTMKHTITRPQPAFR